MKMMELSGRYRIPQDINPYKDRLSHASCDLKRGSEDELGEWHPPRLSGRYKASRFPACLHLKWKLQGQSRLFRQADVEKQYLMNSLPWVWSNDYYQSRLHIWDPGTLDVG